ncbi:hypothetical protein [Bradyrhizobium diversitatis]|uniref:Uncharacterized protein n=1 Tax=Bradyrhizobium diversitatis TaxID=2755406 RepID=A0ABS0NZ59_9BRAD|nr:hypothetical protein [Bradyrhizobium diversitatis]MBH5386302.1 hypothetical protein [Bradyrhizobium diversitatis]
MAATTVLFGVVLRYLAVINPFDSTISGVGLTPLSHAERHTVHAQTGFRIGWSTMSEAGRYACATRRHAA